MVMDKERKRNLSIACLLSFLLTAGLLTVLYAVNGNAPFGDSASLACSDANNQYLDFFLYYKRLISGTAGFSYSFSKMLGGTNVALFAYYLASPLNLLIAFFPTDRILFFFDLLILSSSRWQRPPVLCFWAFASLPLAPPVGTNGISLFFSPPAMLSPSMPSPSARTSCGWTASSCCR